MSVVEPYELPEGWKWCRLGDVAEIIMGQSPAGTSMTENQNDIVFIGGTSDMGEELPNISRYTSEPTKLSKRDDVIVCIRATLGRPIFSDGIYCLGRGVAGIRSETLMKEYIKYGFLNFEQYLYDKATGSTFLQVSSKYLNEMPFPLPPTLAEQQRIVNRIESMFAKLDEAKEKAQNVVDGFETRKAAILHKAFTGELTAKWRKENEKGLSTCVEGNLSEDDISVLDKISLDENFVKVVKLTNSLVNKLYNKPTTKEKVFPAVFVLDKDNLKSLYDKIQYKLGLHNIQDTEFAISVLGIDEKDNKQSTEYMSIDEFLNTNDTKSLLTKLVVMEWKTKLFLNNSRTPISKIIGEEFNIEIAISSAPKDSSDEAYFIFNDYPIKTKGIIQVSVVHSNQVIADELIQHVGDFVSGIEDKRIKKDSFIYNHKREIAQSAEKILGIPALIPLVHLFFNINSCLNSTNSVIKLISICMGFFILSITFGNTIGELIYNLLNKRKSTSWIILNDYTKQEYEKYKSYSNPARKAFFLYLLPIILNIFSAIISQNIGN